MKQFLKSLLIIFKDVDSFDTDNYHYNVNLWCIRLNLYVISIGLYIPYNYTCEGHQARFERISDLIDRLNNRFDSEVKPAIKKRKVAKAPAKKAPVKKTVAKKPAVKKPVAKKPAKKK